MISPEADVGKRIPGKCLLKPCVLLALQRIICPHIPQQNDMVVSGIQLQTFFILFVKIPDYLRFAVNIA